MQARKKYGFATFVKVANPIVHPIKPRLPFNMATDLVTATELFIYLTPTGRAARNQTPNTTRVLFTWYNSDGTVHIYIPEQNRFTDVSIEKLHLAEGV